MTKKLVAIAILASSVAAQAQVFTPPYNPGLELLNDSIRGNVDDDADKHPSSQPVIQPTKTPSVSLQYAPLKTRTRQNLTNFSDKMRATDPVGADKIQQLFASFDVIAELDKQMRLVGLQVNNVADCYSIWWIEAWEAVNQKSMGNSRAMHQAVKRQVLQALSHNAAFAGFNDAQKQEMSEAFLIQAMLIDGHVSAAGNDAQQLAAVATAVNQGAKSMGLDLTTMTLTEDGFVPR